MKKLVFSIFIFIFIVSCLNSQELSISELEQIIIDAEALSNVNARRYIDHYWQLTNLYLANNDYDNAYRIIIKGLRLEPWNCIYQLKAVDIEAELNEYEKALNRMLFIINNIQELASIYVEKIELSGNINIDDIKYLQEMEYFQEVEFSYEQILEVVSKLNEELNKLNNITIDNTPLFLPNYFVYIAAYSDTDPGVVELTAARISQEYGIGVRIINIDADLSETNMRNRRLIIYNDIINDVKKVYSKNAIDNFLMQIGLTESDLDTFEGKRLFVYTLLNQSEDGKDRWRVIEETKPQYDANVLQNQLYNKFNNIINEPYSLGILGITGEDIFANDFNFLFGWAQPKLGVMSYARFAAGNISQEQFEKRVIMQSFSSIGLILGIPRCTYPSCSRAYPNSLIEHDRKEDKLCEECRNNLRALYLAKLQE